MATYVTVEEANQYFEERLFSEVWDNSTDEDKDKAIKMATRVIDRQPMKGKKVDPSQPLQFPRSFVGPREVIPNERRFQTNMGWWDQSEIPQAAKDACCEQAMFLLALTEYERGRYHQNVLGVVGEMAQYDIMDPMLVRQNRKRTVLCPDAREFLLPYLIGVASIQ
jgi:hypothetical protein